MRSLLVLIVLAVLHCLQPGRVVSRQSVVRSTWRYGACGIRHKVVSAAEETAGNVNGRRTCNSLSAAQKA